MLPPHRVLQRIHVDDIVFDTYVAGQRQDLARGTGRHGAADRRNACTFTLEPFGDRTADSTGSAGDECHLARQRLGGTNGRCQRLHLLITPPGLRRLRAARPGRT